MQRKAVIYNCCIGQSHLCQRYSEMCSAMAYALDYEVIGIFIDESEDRPKLERAAHAIVDGEADTFISFNRATVSRNTKEFTEFHKNFMEPHTRLLLINPDTFPDDV